MAMLVHKAAEERKLTKKGKAELAALLGPRIHDAIILPKLDGVYGQFISYGDEWQAFTRTGERMPSLETPERLELLRMAGDKRRRYIGEAWIPGVPHKTINGMARRQSVQPDLGFYLHDSYDSFMVDKYGNDINAWRGRMQAANAVVDNMLINTITGVSLEALLQVGTIAEPTMSELVAHAERAVAQAKRVGGNIWDGLILRDNTFPFTPGKGLDGGVYKLKPRDSLDLRIVGEVSEFREAKLGGYLTVEYKGKTTNVGSGMTQEMLHNIEQAGLRGRTVYVGGIAEVTYLDITEAGALREPVLKAIRFDKEEPDV